MGASQYIEFKKQRELGDILTDTFGFIRNEFKPFFSALLKIVGPYLLVMLVSLGFYFYAFGDILNFATITAESQVFSPLIMIFALFSFVISSVLVYAVSYGSVLSYIQSYVENKGETDFNAIKKQVYAKFWPIVGLGFLVFLSVFVGLLFCFIPGIYLAVPLSISFSMLIFQNKNASDAYSESFSLVKDNWWITFATLFVVYIIIYVASLAFSLPAVIYTWAKMGIFSGEMDATSMNAFADPIYLALNILSQMIQFLMNIILLVATALIYFNLNEKKNFTGTYERIGNIGKSSD
ncbi:hypothetical protein MTsPCn5_36390 [Croceitalea sp. MTPC5]|uniref:hypothetical protein n=1 Tax=Croceitalea sp. MTPC5 TaxID=3056565 RepID=UPI002B3E2A74|nr:hypothetical protein MTsPCn5_36390 [Croceitalea sp. MTPC5]